MGGEVKEKLANGVGSQ